MLQRRGFHGEPSRRRQNATAFVCAEVVVWACHVCEVAALGGYSPGPWGNFLRLEKEKTVEPGRGVGCDALQIRLPVSSGTAVCAEASMLLEISKRAPPCFSLLCLLPL